MSIGEEFWEVICPQSQYLYLLLVFVTVLGVLNLIAVLLPGQTQGAFIVSLMVFVILAITGCVAGFILWRCDR